MSALPELFRLFTELASHLRRSSVPAVNGDGDGDGDGDEVASLVSSLTRSLDLDHQMSPKVRVLDVALALMGFKTTEVYRARIECLVRTIASVLSSSVSCKVLRSEVAESELLLVGSSISSGDCDELIRECANVVDILQQNSRTSTATAPFDTLLYAVMKAAVSSSSFDALSPSLPTFPNEKSGGYRRNAISNLIHLLPEEPTIGSHGIPSRLLVWYLDPILLKRDISQILRATIQRPFLCLKEQLHDRIAWRSIIVCLVTSPTLFIETRALLHKWFLVTCSSSVLDFQIAILSAVLDVLSRPMWWGVSMEWGLKLPFSREYFPPKHHELLAILSGSISCRNFLDLVSCIGLEVLTATKDSYEAHPSGGNEASVIMADNISFWDLVLQFPSWFYFATTLIFSSSQDSYLCKFIIGDVKVEAPTDIELHQAATHFLSWVLSPINEAHRHMLVNHIQEISRSWMTRCRSNCSYEHKSNPDIHKKTTLGRSKKLRIPRVNDYEKLRLAEDDDVGSTIRVWLKEFDAVCVEFYRTATYDVLEEAKVKENSNAKSKLLFSKVPLGIFILSPSYLDEDGSELLLHYAATGEILQLGEMHKRAETYFPHNDVTLLPVDSYQSALYGACFIFTLFDIIEDMSAVFFDKEDSQVNYFSLLKSKASRYLHRCVKALLTFQTCNIRNDKAGGREMMTDLFSRLKKWMQQGREVFDGYQVFDDVVEALAKRLTVPKMNIMDSTVQSKSQKSRHTDATCQGKSESQWGFH